MSSKRTVSPIQLPGGPESARTPMDFRPRPAKGAAGPKGESAPEPAAAEPKELTQDEHPTQKPVTAKKATRPKRTPPGQMLD